MVDNVIVDFKYPFYMVEVDTNPVYRAYLDYCNNELHPNDIPMSFPEYLTVKKEAQTYIVHTSKIHRDLVVFVRNGSIMLRAKSMESMIEQLRRMGLTGFIRRGNMIDK